MAGPKVLVMVGTRKGGFIFSSDAKRKRWEVSDIQFKSWNVMHIQMDPRDGRMHAAAQHFVYGATTHYSDDLGRTWTQAAQVPILTRPSKSGRPAGSPEEMDFDANGKQKAIPTPEKLNKVWTITPGRASEPGVLYAGAQPASLFVSRDRGETWTLNEPFYDHPHRGKWNPGAGGLTLHTIIPDPVDPQRMYVAVSAGGCYRTDDGGQSWAPYNKNVRVDFGGDTFPEYGQCVHKMAMHPSRPQVLFQQNHCGVYRSDNAGEDWVDIGEGRLPTRFGFPIAIHPHEPATAYIVPEESEEYHMSVEGQLSVWRTRDDGKTWQQLTQGLPAHSHVDVLRDALATDPLDQPGLYMGTNTGQLFYSRDAGDSWELLADFLPPIVSVEAAVVAG